MRNGGELEDQDIILFWHGYHITDMNRRAAFFDSLAVHPDMSAFNPMQRQRPTLRQPQEE